MGKQDKFSVCCASCANCILVVYFIFCACRYPATLHCVIMTITFEFFLFFTRNVVLHSTPNIVVRDEGVYFQMEGGRAEDEGHRAALSQGSILSSSRNLRCQE